MSPDRDAEREPEGARGAEAGGRSDAERDPGDDGSEDPPAETLLEALSVRRHARVGLAVGLGLAGFLYLSRLRRFELSLTGSGGYFLGLALVLAATTAAVVTAALSLKTFLDPVLDGPAWRRRGAATAVLGGCLWAALPAVAALAEAGTITRGVWHTATSLGALTLLVGAIALHLAVTEAAGRIERAAYWIVVVGLVFAAGNATGDPSPMRETTAGPAATPFLVSAVVATAATVPLAATAELTGRLPRLRTRALQVGALCGTLGAAWLVSLGGWSALQEHSIATVPAALAVLTVPTGAGWAVAGQGLWRAATPARLAALSGRPATDDGDR